jgi:hypothetical protein
MPGKRRDGVGFDIEIFLQPVRQDLAECLELVADMVREREPWR